MSRIVVIGAGMGGLAVAARLAATGHEVLVLEQAATVGGKLGIWSRDGWTFDTGPSLLTMPHLYRELFDDTGGPLDGVLDLVRLDPACRYRFADGTWLDMPGERAAIPPALNATLGAGIGDQWAVFLARAEAIWHATAGPFLQSTPTVADLLRLSRHLGDLRTVAPWSTLRDLGARYLRDPRLRTLLDRYATYTGSDPRRAPAALATVPYVEQEFGSWYVRGGLRRLGQALHDRAVACGATIHTSAAVTRVLLDRGRVTGVRLADGATVPADLVVSDADASTLYGCLLPPDVAGGVRRRLRRATPSLSGFMLFLALRGRDPATTHHTVLFPDDYDDEFDCVFGNGVFGNGVFGGGVFGGGVFGSSGRRPRPVPDPTVYISAPDDPALRPDDASEAWFVLVNAPRHDPAAGVDWDSPGLARAYAMRVLDVLAGRGVDVRDRVVWARTHTPADLQRTTWSPGGSIYGSSSNGAHAAFLRPANRSPVLGLYLVGGSAHPGGGLPLVALSARIVAELIGPA
jgi:phytoene desaturase